MANTGLIQDPQMLLDDPCFMQESTTVKRNITWAY